MEIEWYIGIGAAVVVAAAILALWLDRQHPRHLLARIERTRAALVAEVRQKFLVASCVRCYEFAMALLGVSPNGRSVHYQCLHCEKKLRAPAGAPDAARVIELWDELCALVEEYHERTGHAEPGDESEPDLGVTFDAPAAPLPFEQTTRTPIPEAVRSQVWRRDLGRCVECGSKQNLQFDHIIPFSQGGATSVANLQLLCQPCNAAKGDKI